MDITFSAANTVGLNNPGTEIITLVKDGSGNFINPPSYDKMRAYLRSGEVPMLFVSAEGGETGSLYQLVEYSETENKIRFSNDKTTIEFSAGSAAPVVSDVVPKPLTYDYMPEGYPKKTVQTSVLMVEQVVAFVDDKNIYYGHLADAFDIVIGQTYTVNWDGTEYECTGSAYNEKNMLFIGNLSISGVGDNTGEPFLYVPAGSGFNTLDTSASHTISVKTTEETVTPMAEEFLPDTALITYDLGTSTYSSDFTNDELRARLLDGKQIVLYTTDGDQYLYLTKWAKIPSGRIDLAFAGDAYSVSLNTDGTIGNKPLS